MKKIIFLITLIALLLTAHVNNVYSQMDEQNFTDTLIVGGIYKVELDNGKHFTGELISMNDSTIEFQTDNAISSYGLSRIKTISIANINIDTEKIETLSPVYEERKYRFIGSLQTGINIPFNNFGKAYDPGIGFQISAYHLFNTIFGLGTEFQFNLFSGKELSYQPNYNETQISTKGFNTFFVKINGIFGNLKPKNKLVFYGLLGIGVEYYSYGSGGTSFIYGPGLGAVYKYTKKIGFNCEIQYNVMPDQDIYYYYYYYDGSDEYSSFLSIKAGIMFTVF